MLQQPPRRASYSSMITEEKLKDFQVPEYTDLEMEKLADPTNVKRKVDELKRSGRLPALAEVVEADVVDAVKWIDQKAADLKDMKVKDIQSQNPWIDELQEDLITYDVAPSVRADDAATILKELKKEIEAKQSAGFGPDARNYLFNLQRELEVLIDKL